MRLAWALAAAILLTAQEPKFNVQSRLVTVPVTVTDAKGRFISDIEPSDFVLHDKGEIQQVIVDTFTTGVAPIALIVAVQTSGISAPVLAKAQKIGSMIQPLVTGERGCAGLIAFDERIRWRQECTSNPDELSRAFSSLQPGEEKQARMLDAALEGIDRLRKRSNVRRVLLLISESRDRGSENELETILIAAQSAGVSFYAATYSAWRTAFTTKVTSREPPPEPKLPRPNRTEPLGPKGRVQIPPPEQRVDILGGIGELARLGKANDAQVLAEKTGGAVFPFTRQKGPEDAISKLGEELHSQYLLSFAPSRPEPGYHPVEVRLSREGKFRIRAREGYSYAQTTW